MIEEQQQEIDSLKALNEEKDARIEDLNSQLDALKKELDSIKSK